MQTATLDTPSTDTRASEISPLAQAVIATTAAGAAVVHFAMFPDHFQESTLLGLGIAVAGWFQLAIAALVMLRPSRKVVGAGLVGSLALIGAWAMSRTVGLPLPGDAGNAEDPGTIDLVCVAFEAVTAFTCGYALVRKPSANPSRRLSPAAALVVPVLAVGLITTTALAAPESANHAHAGGAEHDAGAGHDADGEHGGAEHSGDHAATDGQEHHSATPAVAYTGTLPVDLGGVEGVTAQQQGEAEAVVTNTLMFLDQWADPAVAEAAGFRSIGDGGTGTEHLVNQEFMDDDIILDPHYPESLVYDTTGGERRLVAAMYMLRTGTPMSEVPTIGGELMQWHIHNNLCYTAEGLVRGVTDADGNCAPGLFKPPETPMIHVWIEPHPCGPFAALEGIGGGQIAEGEERLCDSAHGSHGDG